MPEDSCRCKSGRFPTAAIFMEQVEREQKRLLDKWNLLETITVSPVEFPDIGPEQKRVEFPQTVAVQ